MSNSSRTASAKLNRYAPPPKSSTSKKYLPLAILVAVALVLLAAVGGYQLGSQRASDSDPTSQPPVNVDQVDRSVSGLSPEEDRRDATEAAYDLLNAAEIEGDEAAVMTQLEAIDSGDFSGLSEEFVDGFHLVDVFQSDQQLESVAYQSVIAFRFLAFEDDAPSMPEDEVIQQSVYIDSELGIAQVPVGMFLGSPAPFSFEMVYVDGEWKLSPYTFIELINLSALGANPEVPDVP